MKERKKEYLAGKTHNKKRVEKKENETVDAVETFLLN